MTGGGGLRIIAVRGRKPNEIELPSRVMDELRKQFEAKKDTIPYINSLNTDYLTLTLNNIYTNESPIWIEDLEITVLSSEEYKHNLYLQ